MGQFDSATDAALAQLNFEEISKTPGGEFAEITSDLLKLVGARGPWSITGGALSLLQRLRALAGASYASNLVFVITAVRDDLADLRARHAGLQERIDSLGPDPRFAEAIAALALRAMHTSVKDRLKRMARIVVNGVKEDDLEPESLDDMMRAAAELKDFDLQVLNTVLGQQQKTNTLSLSTVDRIINQPIEVWRPLNQSGFFTTENHMEILTSLERLKSVGFCAEIQTTTPSWLPRALVTPLGETFLKRVREIAD